MAPVQTTARERVRAAPCGPAVLAALINGVALAQIASAEGVKPKTIENIVRRELRKRWVAPAQDYAKLQIVRLEAIAVQLKEKSKGGDLPTIDRLLKVMDRLDRYHGFTKLAALSQASREDVKPNLFKKMVQAASQEGKA